MPVPRHCGSRATSDARIVRDRMLVDLDEHERNAVIEVHLEGHCAPVRHATYYWRNESEAGCQPSDAAAAVRRAATATRCALRRAARCWSRL
ncbi:hypothetical protein ACWELJ_26220 [Nocardia sp. NPDC004582]